MIKLKEIEETKGLALDVDGKVFEVGGVDQVEKLIEDLKSFMDGEYEGQETVTEDDLSWISMVPTGEALDIVRKSAPTYWSKMVNSDKVGNSLRYAASYGQVASEKISGKWHFDREDVKEWAKKMEVRAQHGK